MACCSFVLAEASCDRSARWILELLFERRRRHILGVSAHSPCRDHPANDSEYLLLTSYRSEATAGVSQRLLARLGEEGGATACLTKSTKKRNVHTRKYLPDVVWQLLECLLSGLRGIVSFSKQASHPLWTSLLLSCVAWVFVDSELEWTESCAFLIRTTYCLQIPGSKKRNIFTAG